MFLLYSVLYIVIFYLKDSCPSIDNSPPIEASLLPFEVSKSKRSSGASEKAPPKIRRMFRRSVKYHPVVKTISPDRSFDWKGFVESMREKLDDNANTTKTETPKHTNYKIVPLTIDLIDKLGVLVLPSRRLCFVLFCLL